MTKQESELYQVLSFAMTLANMGSKQYTRAGLAGMFQVLASDMIARHIKPEFFEQALKHATDSYEDQIRHYFMQHQGKPPERSEAHREQEVQAERMVNDLMERIKNGKRE
ncbi:MAG: hypothetical protein E6R03_11605 [Hyphomicrobiaceae bacterium]|nr:MAG: hypothetical protein E6R03_11605 [Hyphomicrobiaceae bacterium]